MASAGPSDLKNAHIPNEMSDALKRLAGRNGTSDTSQVSLWFESSLKQARAWGISDAEFVRWIDADYWNIAGDSSTARAVEVYRSLAGEQGVLIAIAGISPESAVQQATTQGIKALLEGCEAMIGLSQLSTSLPVEHTEVEPAKLEEPKPIDFS